MREVWEELPAWHPREAIVSGFMPNIRSQAKRDRQNEKRRLRNKAVRSEVKTRVKRVNEAVGSGDQDATDRELRLAIKKLDTAAAKGVIHKNKAANHKSALMRAARRSAPSG